MVEAKTHFSKWGLFIRSLLFSVFSIAAIFFYSSLIILMFCMPLRWRHAVARDFSKRNLGVLKRLCHVDYVVEGLENIPTHETGIVMAKHQSTWETFYLPMVFINPAMIAKRELLWIPFFGWAFALSKPITIDRQKKTSAMQQIINKGIQCLKANRWVVFFPEGTRIPYGKVGNYRPGGARLAIAANSFIIPVAHNAGKCWPRRKFLKYPGTIRVVIGQRIPVEGRSAEELTKIVKDWIEGTIQKLD